MTYSFLSHLACTACDARFSADEVHSVCVNCGKVLVAQYDLAAASKVMTRATLDQRPFSMWRYHEVLPVRDPHNVVTLAEGGTPLLPAARFGSHVGMPNLLIKDEGRNPTGSFKARGLSVAVSRARELGITSLAIPSTGNAASALSAYAARAGMDAHVFLTHDSLRTTQLECTMYGAQVALVHGALDQTGSVVRENGRTHRWFDMSTLREPYRVEGKKTMAYELVEQLGWTVPDAIIYPTGGGTGIVGMWKAFAEMEALGLIGSERPRMVAVQAKGCAPIVQAFQADRTTAETWQSVNTLAAGFRAPKTIADYLILSALRESRGTAVTVSDEDMLASMRSVARLEGLYVSLESAATYAAAQKLVQIGYLQERERVVAMNTATGLKHTELLPELDLPIVAPALLA